MATKRASSDHEELVEADGQAVKKSRFMNESPVEIRLLIPSNDAGAIIGKGGEHIKSLRSKYNATVLVPDCPGPERVFTIVCCLCNACSLLLETLKYAPQSGKGVEVKLLIHQSQCGAIIGKSGCNIKEIRQKYSVHIKVYDQCAPDSTDRVVEIKGDPEVVTNTVYHIMDMLASCPPIGENIAYNPINFNEGMIDVYGGYAGTYSFQKGFAQNKNLPARRFPSVMNKNLPARRFPPANHNNGFRGSNTINNNRGSHNFPPFRPPPPKPLMNFNQIIPSRQNFMQGYHSFEDGQSLSNDNFFNDEEEVEEEECDYGEGCEDYFYQEDQEEEYVEGEQEEQEQEFGEEVGYHAGSSNNVITRQVTISNDLAGSIIGKSGSRIRLIREESKALINIDDSVPGSNQRIVTVVGTMRQIQHALSLMQNCIRKYSGRSRLDSSSMLIN
ncbi:hypothetical protein HELRODRAFT_93617 [Helobdella robusta]|uniref:K Homology domain-containing protein n=1 Tax=Helobdella robusta TaxID=6412 RepID=T1G8X0_HELRO|nr:hypothetical protein HELRODRAFT_93617 [Helobdella robusta]ESO13040.1 hypothetical protein HELRODRAFT_93617 [Helobdella robusta]